MLVLVEVIEICFDNLLFDFFEMWLNEVDDIDDLCIEEFENDNFDRLGCVFMKVVFSVLNGVELLLFGCGLGLFKVNECMFFIFFEE